MFFCRLVACDIDENAFTLADVAKVLLGDFFHILRQFIALIVLNLLEIIGFYRFSAIFTFWLMMVITA